MKNIQDQKKGEGFRVKTSKAFLSDDGLIEWLFWIILMVAVVICVATINYFIR